MQRASLCLLIVACLAAGPVYAGCSNPTGNEADAFYNQAYHTYQFCNGTNWIAEGATGGSAGPILISTRTASSSASLQFTNLPTSYNTLFLNCSGLVLGNNSGYYQMEVGEGATPTWEIVAHYTITGAYWGSNGSSSGTLSGTTNTDLLHQGGSSSTNPLSILAYFYNVGSSSIPKYVLVNEGSYVDSTGIFYQNSQWGYWNNDTNPITGIEIVPTAGTIASGTCSLYGMN